MELIFNPINEAVGRIFGQQRLTLLSDSDTILIQGLVAGAMMGHGWAAAAFISDEDFPTEVVEAAEPGDTHWEDGIRHIYHWSQKPRYLRSVDFGNHGLDFTARICFYEEAVDHPHHGLLDVITYRMAAEGGSPTLYFFGKGQEH